MEESKRVKVPFPALPSFNIAASIMSYALYEDEVHNLLHELCNNTRSYSVSHRELLKSFLIVNLIRIRQQCHSMLEFELWFDEEDGSYKSIN